MANLGKMSRSATLRDIAAEAGLSVAAVSKALAGYPHVNADTRRRVLAISQKLNYRPRRRRDVAASPTEKRIAFVIVAPEAHPERTDLGELHFLTSMGREHGMCLELSTIAAPLSEQPALLAERATGVDGILLYGAVGIQLLRSQPVRDLPTVMLGNVIDSELDSIDSCFLVTGDHFGMGRMATRYLIARGHERIGFVAHCEPAGGWFDTWRLGYLAAMVESGLAPLPIANNGPHSNFVVDAVEAHAASAQPPTAYVIPDLNNTDRFLRTLALAGYELPKEDIVIGTSPSWIVGTPMAVYPHVLADLDRLAKTSLELLLLAIEKRAPAPMRVTIPFTTQNMDEERFNVDM